MSATYFGKYISLTYPELIRRGTVLSPVTQGSFSYTNSISSDEHTLIDGNGDTVPGIVIDTTGNNEGGILFKDTVNVSGGVISIKSNAYGGSTLTKGLDFNTHIVGLPNIHMMFLSSLGSLYIGYLGSLTDIGTTYGGTDQASSILNIRSGMTLSDTSNNLSQIFMNTTNLTIRTGNGVSGNGGNISITTYNTSKHISLITYGATSDVRLTSARNINLSAASDNNITSVGQTIITTSTGTIISGGSISPKFKVDSNIHSGTHTSQIYAALNVNIFASGIYNPNSGVTINWIRVGNMVYCTGLFEIVSGGRVINLPIITANCNNVFGVWATTLTKRVSSPVNIVANPVVPNPLTYGTTLPVDIDRLCGRIEYQAANQAACEPGTDIENGDYLYLSFSYELI